MDLLFAGIGLLILLLAGDALVRGAVNLALRLGIPALIVSLTIVAFGTSAPELIISIQAVLEDAPGIALGNVVGSNTANVLLVLGVPALMKGLQTGAHDTTQKLSRHDGGQPLVHRAVLFRTADLGARAADAGLPGRHLRRPVPRSAHPSPQQSAAAAAAVQDGDDLEEVEGADPEMRWWKIIAFLVLGLIGLPMGASILVDAAVNIATAIGVSETVIGLTLVAVGTSLPELATTVMACLRNKADVALGNVIGSNLFNLLAIIGIASFFGDDSGRSRVPDVRSVGHAGRLADARPVCPAQHRHGPRHRRGLYSALCGLCDCRAEMGCLRCR